MELEIPSIVAFIDDPASNYRSRKPNGGLKVNGSANGHTNGFSNGYTDGVANGKSKGDTNGHSTATRKANGMPTEHGREVDRRMDEHHAYEFGGPIGVTAMMVLFPILMYYLWICLWYYHGSLIHPTTIDGVKPFLRKMGGHVYDGAYPTRFAWATYLGLITVQLIFAAVMPGITQNGLPVPSLNYAVLPYHCNCLLSWYSSLVLAFALHYAGIFRLPWIVEEFGSLMTVAIISGFTTSVVIDVLARTMHYGGKPLRMSGVPVYDHFMGVSLNPRIGPVDLKMFAEVRVPWVLLFFISLSGAVKQYEERGRVTGNMAHMVLATGLYVNACAKGEQMIPHTWDMFHEKFGWMLIFWNMAGVPFTYCYPVIYMARSSSSTYEFPLLGQISMFTTLLVCYYIFDTSMAQKSNFKMQQQGEYKARFAFPTLPWSVIENPTYIETKHGNKLLTSGWWAYARKINYTADWFQSLTWGLTAGFNTPITLFYPIFFLCVLTHRCGRDFKKCARKYGDDWVEYCKVVKWRFFPGIY